MQRRCDMSVKRTRRLPAGNEVQIASHPMSVHTGARALDPEGPLHIAYLTYRGKPHVGGQGVYSRHLTKAPADLGHTMELFAGHPSPTLDERVPLRKLPSLDI